ncbi:hypothetical protein PAMP_008944 [Pampus punctatissimus]
MDLILPVTRAGFRKPRVPSVVWSALKVILASPHLLIHKVLTAVVTGDRRRQVRGNVTAKEQTSGSVELE